MSTLRNKVQLIGNLGNNPEIITLESGQKLAKFSLATNENYKDSDGQKQTKTEYTQTTCALTHTTSKPSTNSPQPHPGMPPQLYSGTLPP